MIIFTKGKYTIEHEREIGFMGFETDRLCLCWIENGVKYHKPFIGKPKVSKKGRNFPVNLIPYKYTKKDYEQMLKEEIKRLSTSQK